MNSTDYDEQRRQELNDFQTLLRECKELNHASGAAQRIQRIETLAEKLTQTDLVTPRKSFAMLINVTTLRERFSTPNPTDSAHFRLNL